MRRASANFSARINESARLGPAILAVVFAVLALAPCPAHAQTGWGTILGRVTDQSGAVVPGAKVTLRNEGTNVAVDVKTAPGPVQPARPYQPFGSINFYENGQTANTQALQLSAIRRFGSGLSFDFEYSWTKALDSGGTDTTGTTDPQDIRLDRGNDEFIRQQYLVANYVYELPFGAGRRFLSSLRGPLNAILGGWETTGILTLASGLPFSVNFTSSVQGWPSGRANIVGDPHVSSPSITDWFNASAYALPPQFAYGDSAPYSLFGPGYSEWDASVFKNFKLGERFNLRFETDLFNAINHPSFSNPSSNISVPSQVGRIVSTANTSGRDIQFALRLEF